MLDSEIKLILQSEDYWKQSGRWYKMGDELIQNIEKVIGTLYFLSFIFTSSLNGSYHA